MSEENVQRFTKVVDDIGNHANIIISQVDPDAVGAAIAVARLLPRLNEQLQVRVYYAGAIGHPQNRSLINRYNLRSVLFPIEQLSEQSEAPTILVDSSKGIDERLPEGFVLDPAIVIDHHRGTDLAGGENRFLWIEDVGSACTLVTELYLALQIEWSTEIATLLAMGIYTDTKALVSAGPRDREAYGKLSSSIEASELHRLIEYPLPPSHFAHLTFALNHYKRQGARLVAGAGMMRPEDGDDLSTIADYFLRMEGVTLVVVWGIIKKTVRISARNDNLSTPLDEFLQKRFGPASGAKLAPDGRGEGGARLGLELGVWISETTRPQVEAMVSSRIQELIFNDPEL